MNVVLKANETQHTRLLYGEGAAKSPTEKHYNIPVITLQGHSKSMDRVGYFNHNFTVYLNVFFLFSGIKI